MGKQIRFVMDKHDEKVFFDFIKETGIVFWGKRFQEPEPINELPDESEGGWYQVYLYKEKFGPMIFSEVDGGRKYINPIIAPVIEFSRSIVHTGQKHISRGRLWFEMKHYNANGKIITKDKSINDWYKELSKWIKRNLKYIEVHKNREYVSESFIDMLQNGYELW